MSQEYSILYVDDERGLLEIAKLFLEQSEEFRVETFISAGAALESGRIASYDAIISDYQMPVMDGITFLKAIRERFGDIPFILFTGRGREEVVIEAINNGADFYLQKGGDPTAQFAELAHKIRRAIHRKRAELSIIESEKRLADIINFLPDATFAIDRTDHIIAWNRAIEEMTGIPAADMLGKGDYEYAIPFYGSRRKILIDLIFEPDDLIAKNYAHIIHDKGILIAETAFPRPKGRTVTLMGKASPLYNRQGEVVGAIESIRDISALKETEISLLHAKKDWETIFRAIGHPVFVIDPQNRILDVNDATVQATGMSVAELKGRNCYEVFHAKGTIGPPVSCPCAKLKISGQTETEEIEIEALNGYYSVTCTPVFDEDGRLEKVIHIAMDITSRKHAETELRAAYEQIAASEEELRGQYEELATTQTEFQKQQQQLSEITEMIPGLVYQFYARSDGSMGLYYVSNRGRSIFGFPGNADDFFGWFTGHIYPLDRDAFLRSIDEVVRAGSPWNFEGRFIKPSGERIWFQGMSRPVRRGPELIFNGILFDITDRKTAEIALRESEQKFRTVVETAEEGIWIIDKDFLTVFTNRKMEEIIGYPQKEMTGRPVWNFVLPDDAELMKQMLLERNTGKTGRYEHRWVRKDGTIIWCLTSGTPLILPDGTFTGSFGMFTDITGRKEMEDALRESEENYRSIIENIQDVVYRSDRAGILTMVSPSFITKLGYTSADECIGKNIAEQFWMYPERRQEFLKELEKKGSVSGYEIVLKKKDGTPVIVSASSHFYCARDGTIAGVEGIFHDITEIKEAQQQIQLLASLNDISPASVTVHSLEGEMLYANQRTFELHGWTRDEFMALNLHQLDVPSSEELIQKRIDELIRTGSAAFDVEHYRKDGSTIALQVNAKITRWNGRDVIMSVATEISGKKPG